MQRRSVFTDPSFWVLTAVNVYLVWYYYQHHEVFTTLIWIYWCQSALMGVFNFFDMLTVRKVAAQQSKDGAPSSDSFSLKRPAAFFSLLHYGGFHLVYLIFVATMKRSGPFDYALFKYCVLAFLGGQIIQFIQHKREQRTQATNLGTMFFIPYLRIIPMHLTILAPSFLKVSNVGVFLVLKCVTDMITYILTRRSYKDKNMDAAAMATQQSSGLM